VGEVVSERGKAERREMNGGSKQNGKGGWVEVS